MTPLLKKLLPSIALSGLACFGLGLLAGSLSPTNIATNVEKAVPAEMAAVFNKGILECLPPNINETLPPDLVAAIAQTKFEDINSNIGFENFFRKNFTTFSKEHKVKANILVVNENGEKIENASVWLSEELKSDEVGFEYKPYKIKKKTNKAGECSFEGIKPVPFYPLAFLLFFDYPKARISKDGNFETDYQILVKAAGYETAKTGFLNIDKTTVSIIANLGAMFARMQKQFPEETKRWGKLRDKLPISFKDVTEPVVVKIVLKKSKNGSVPPIDNEPDEAPAPSEEIVVSIKAKTPSKIKNWPEFMATTVAQSAPPEILSLFKNTKPESIIPEKELHSFNNKIEALTRKDRLKLKVLVKGEDGFVISNATLKLESILRYIDSQRIHDRNSRYECIKPIEQITNKDGESAIIQLPKHAHLPLMARLAGGKLPEDNFALTVKAPGYKTTKVTFVNIDKKLIAVAANVNILWGKRFALIHPDQINYHKFPPTLNIPEEYLSDIVCIEVVLKKETKKTP